MKKDCETHAMMAKHKCNVNQIMSNTNKVLISTMEKESPISAAVDDKGSKKVLKDDLKRHHKHPSSLLIKSKDATKWPQDVMETEADLFAKQLFDLQGDEKKKVAQHLSKQDEFGMLVAKKYMELLTFSRIGLEESLRLLLKKLALLGETQERERILNHFARRYRECNPHFLEGDLDAIHTLVCATVLLNTDLHRVNVGGVSRMTSKEFVSNLSGLAPNGGDFPSSLLKEIYRLIKKKPLPWCEIEVPKNSNSSSKKSPSLHIRSTMDKSSLNKRGLRSQSMHQQDLQKIRPTPLFQEGTGGRRIGAGRSSKTKTLPRAQGVLWRKSILDRDGNKTPKRKRRWKLFFVVLQGLELQLTKRDSADTTVVPLHHSLAEAEATNHSTKRPNVVRLSLANGSVALYQASSKDEQKNWIRSVNRNAALLSSAPLSAGIGSQLKFQRPLLPSASSTLPLNKQLNEQQDRLESLCSELDGQETHRPSEGAPATEKQYYGDKLNYLRHEVHKYEVYTNALAELLRSTHPQHTATPSKAVQGEGKLRSVPETGSMLSVSPSEPGAVACNTLSAYPRNDETAGSVGDLLEADPKKRKNNHFMIGTFPLGPTSSLPNLHPQHFRRFPESPRKIPLMHGSATSGTYDLVPSVSEADSENSSVRLIRQNNSPLNANNSNNSDVFNPSAYPSFPTKSKNGDVSVSSAEKSNSKPRTFREVFSSNTMDRNVTRSHRVDEITNTPSPLVVSTSRPPVIENKTLLRGGPKTSGGQNTRFYYKNSPPETNRRKKEKMTARRSYLQAMSGPPHP